MPFFFIHQIPSPGDDVEIEGSDAKHIAASLRLIAGDNLVLCTGEGRSFAARIMSASPRRVVARVMGERPSMASVTTPTLAQALIKHDRFEWMIEKAVELGVTKIIPFTSKRTIPQYATHTSTEKQRRWGKIAMAAAQQSGLPFEPIVESPLPFTRLTQQLSSFATAILFWESEQKRDMHHITPQLTERSTKKIIIICGPEGGFSSDEVELAKANGALTVSLGSQILRAETAPLVAISLVQYQCGNLSLKGHP